MTEVLFPDVQEQLRSDGRQAAGRRQRRRRTGGAALALGVAGVVGVAAFPNSQPGGDLLGPQAAVAQANENLASDGILEWHMRHDHIQGAPVGERESGVTETLIWRDLKTGSQAQSGAVTSRGERIGDSDVWSSNVEALVRMPGSRKVHVIPVRGQARSPLDAAKSVLADPNAELREDEFEGQQAVVVRQESKGDSASDFVTETWLTREREPKILLIKTKMICAEGARCDRDPGDGKPTVIPSEMRTLTWKIHPRTPDALSRVARPAWAKR